jgi:hypothetical protein
VTAPALGRSSPAKTRSSVDLPAPFGPDDRDAARALVGEAHRLEPAARREAMRERTSLDADLCRTAAHEARDAPAA